MAATEQNYRNPRTLDIIFAVSSVLMLASIVWMFADDYFKPWKTEQKVERGVASAHAQREGLRALMNYRLQGRTLADILKRIRNAENEEEAAKARQELAIYLDNFSQAEHDVAIAKVELESVEKANASAARRIAALKARVDAAAQSIKADHDSIESLLFIDIDNRDAAPAVDDKLWYERDKKVVERRAQLAELKEKLAKAQLEVEKVNEELRELKNRPWYRIHSIVIALLQGAKVPKTVLDKLESLKNRGIESREKFLEELEKVLTEEELKAHQDAILKYAQVSQTTAQEAVSFAEDRLKQLRGEYNRFRRLAEQKRWKLGDTIRGLPILDAFASPTRIQQSTHEDLPRQYGSFKAVTRFDRCTTCHLGIDRHNFDRETVEALRRVDEELQANLDTLRQELTQYAQELEERLQAAANPREARRLAWELEQYKKKKIVAGFDLNDLPTRVEVVDEARLNDARVKTLSAHPRLDLFVDDKSPHPAQKFGCSSCHEGQGLATSFKTAVHMPNNAEEMSRWKKVHHWEPEEFWEYPMLAKRFQESACLKCHHQVTDLIRNSNQVEAPKLLRGYELVKENGCFGCHEIAGIKGGRAVGPDLRLEPNPPLDALTPAEQAALKADPLNPPGTMRKVGPSLKRITEKTNPQWVAAWLLNPRLFRPDTRMPHFYGLSNNDAKALEHTDQKDFPKVEIEAMTAYLFQESKAYLRGEDRFRAETLAKQKQLQDRLHRQNALLDKQRSEPLTDAEVMELEKVKLWPQDQKQLAELTRRLELFQKPTPLWNDANKLHLLDGEGNVITRLPPSPKDDKAQQEQLVRGRRLFTERGCLACHSHEATETEVPGFIALTSTANFGPDLSRVAAKLGSGQGDGELRRAWLIQWLLNPNVHSPRTRMPITHLTLQEADDLAAWLLAQPATGWKPEPVSPARKEAVESLARQHLVKTPTLTRDEVEELLKPEGDHLKGLTEEQIARKKLPIDADERALTAPLTEDKLKWYIGKKTIGRLGCFGCHDIPGFETAKPIGTPLNDWGRKDHERLAFEDIRAYVKNHYDIVDSLDAAENLEPGKEPFEAYFYNFLKHGNERREGFLYQKLREPRSYDWHRDRTWDDRLRMPQFKFGRSKRKPPKDETDQQKQARLLAEYKEEAAAREAVMTFILGLAGEPVPLKFVHNPSPEKLAAAKGRQVLDTFNCAGCHQVQAGVYQFKRSPDVLKELFERAGRRRPGERDPEDYPFVHNAWMGTLSPFPDQRIVIHGIPMRKEENSITLWLTRAVRFHASPGEILDEDGKTDLVKIAGERDVPAGTPLTLPLNDMFPKAMTPPYGGAFVDLLVPYLDSPDRPYANITSKDWARGALPPPLLREGEKVQTDWLFNFLLKPGKIRHQQQDGGIMVLRMPRFNMSKDDAETLTHYFAAVDKLANPSETVPFPNMEIVQREREFWQKQNRLYLSRLNADRLKENEKVMLPYWARYVEERLLPEMPRRIADAENFAKEKREALEKARAAEKKNEASIKAAEAELAKAIKAVEDLNKEAENLREQLKNKDFPAFQQRWRESDVYATDAFRLIANSASPCIGCHQIGTVGTDKKGPSLDLAAQRLRPEWTLRWLAKPVRLMTYQTEMPQNFPYNKPEELNKLFVGTAEQKIQAIRDLLMFYPHAAEMPATHFYMTTPGAK